MVVGELPEGVEPELGPLSGRTKAFGGRYGSSVLMGAKVWFSRSGSASLVSVLPGESYLAWVWVVDVVVDVAISEVGRLGLDICQTIKPRAVAAKQPATMKTRARRVSVFIVVHLRSAVVV